MRGVASWVFYFLLSVATPVWTRQGSPPDVVNKRLGCAGPQSQNPMQRKLCGSMTTQAQGFPLVGRSALDSRYIFQRQHSSAGTAFLAPIAPQIGRMTGVSTRGSSQMLRGESSSCEYVWAGQGSGYTALNPRTQGISSRSAPMCTALGCLKVPNVHAGFGRVSSHIAMRSLWETKCGHYRIGSVMSIRMPHLVLRMAETGSHSDEEENLDDAILSHRVHVGEVDEDGCPDAEAVEISSVTGEQIVPSVHGKALAESDMSEQNSQKASDLAAVRGSGDVSQHRQPSTESTSLQDSGVIEGGGQAASDFAGAAASGVAGQHSQLSIGDSSHEEPDISDRQCTSSSDSDAVVNSDTAEAASREIFEGRNFLGSKLIGVDYGLRRTGICVSVGYAPRALPLILHNREVNCLCRLSLSHASFIVCACFRYRKSEGQMYVSLVKRTGVCAWVCNVWIAICFCST